MLTSQGYEIHIRETDVLLVDRRIWGLKLGMMILGALAGILLLVGGVPLAAREPLLTRAPAYGLAAAGVGLILLVIRFHRMVRERRSRPLDQIAGVLVIDRQASELRTREGESLAPLDRVRASMHLDLMTRGWTRSVALSWPGSERVVFRSVRRRSTRLVLEALRGAGVG